MTSTSSRINQSPIGTCTKMGCKGSLVIPLESCLTPISNKRRRESCSSDNLIKKATPLVACVRLKSCLLDAKSPAAKSIGAKGKPKEKPFALSMKTDCHGHSSRLKDIAVLVKEKHIQTLLKELKRSPVNGFPYSKSPIDISSDLECVNTKIDLDESECRVQEVNLPDPFWEQREGKTTSNWQRVYPDNITKTLEPDQLPALTWSTDGTGKTDSRSNSVDMDLDLTPPCSTESDSISSQDPNEVFEGFSQTEIEKEYGSEATKPGSRWLERPTRTKLESISSQDPSEVFEGFSQMEIENEYGCETVKPISPESPVAVRSDLEQHGPRHTCQQKDKETVCRRLEVQIEQIIPTSQQLNNLYRRQKLHKQDSFRENRLRPKQALRQFVPFAFPIPSSPKKKKKMKINTPSAKTSEGKRHFVDKVKSSSARRRLCQEEIFATKDQLKNILNKKKEAYKRRNMYENALDSINHRLFRQNHFWRMLPS